MKHYRTTRSLGTTLFGGALLISFSAATATAEIFKADNPDALNLGTSWVGGAAPSSSEVAVWNNGVSAANAIASLGADLDWLGIRIADPAAPIAINAGNALTLGAAGVDLSAATQDLYLSNAISLGAAQTWNVGAGRTLALGGAVSGANSLTKSGDGTLVLGVANTYSGGTTNTAGILQISAAASLGTAMLTLNGGTLTLPSPGVTVVNPIRAAAGTTSMIIATNTATNPLLNGVWSGSGTVLISNTFILTVNGVMDAFSGTIRLVTPNGSTFRFNSGGGNTSFGSPNATFDLGNDLGVLQARNAGTMNIGALKGGTGTRVLGQGAGTGTLIYSIGASTSEPSTTYPGAILDATTTRIAAITKVGAGTLTLTGTNAYTGPTTINAGTLQVGDGGITGEIGPRSLVVNNNSSLTLNRSDTTYLSNSITGTGGSIVKQNANTLTFYGTNASASVKFQVNAGSLAMAEGGVIQGPITLASGAFFDVTSAPSFVLGSTLAGTGTVTGSLVASNNATISPGGGGIAGSLTFANDLTEADNVVNSLDLSDDPTGLVKANDVINITGNLALSGTNTVLINPLNGSLANGTYTLIKYTGSLVSGGLSNLTVNVAGTLTNPPNAIALIVNPVRPAASLVWKGDGTANTWDTSSSNWLNGAALDRFLAGDSVRFTDTGSNVPPVNLVGVLTPATTIVDAAKNFTLVGGGSIVGSGGLIKTNTGSLSVLNANGYTGPTVIGGGTLILTNLANGGVNGPVGASTAAASNLVFHGATLRYEGLSGTTDRGATLNGSGGIINVTTDTENLTLGGTLTGPGALTKTGPGTLTLSGVSDFTGGTAISNGVLALGSQAANGAGLGPTNSPVTFHGGTLELFGYNGDNAVRYSATRNPLVVPAGQTGTLRMFSRGPTDNSGITSPLTGSGTLTLVVNYTRGSLDGDWSAFSGSLVVTGKAAADHFRINNTFGYSNASVYLNDGVSMYRNGGANTTTDIGELAGSTGAFLGLSTVSQNNAVANPTWRVGAKNTSATFAGTIRDDTSTSIIKVGTGTWTLTGINTYSGATTVSNGVLALGDSGSLDNSSVIALAAPGILDVSGRFDPTLSLGLAVGQTLRGDGTLRGSLTVGALGTNSPGFSIGTLTVTNAITLQSGSTTVMEINRDASPRNDRLVGGTISLGGTLVVANLGGTLQIGDSFDLFDGPMTGSFESVVLPSFYTFNTNNLTVNGTISVTGVPTLPTISTVAQQGGELVLGGNAGLALANATYYVVSSTNIAAPLATWTPVLTNLVLPDGSFSATNSIVPGTAQDYFRLLFP